MADIEDVREQHSTSISKAVLHPKHPFRTHSLSGFKHGFTHPLNGATSVPSRPSRNETGQPCKLPVSVVSGVLMSAWASICASEARPSEWEGVADERGDRQGEEGKAVTGIQERRR